jgi:hypothetical protein
MVNFKVYCAWVEVPWITSMVLWKHEDDLVICDAFRFQEFVDEQNIDCVSVVEEKFGTWKEEINIVLVGILILKRSRKDY